MKQVILDRTREAMALPELPLLNGRAIASLLAPLNPTMIAVALPDIRAHFGIGVGALTWLVTASATRSATTAAAPPSPSSTSPSPA